MACAYLGKSCRRLRTADTGTLRIPTGCAGLSKRCDLGNEDSRNLGETAASADTHDRPPQSRTWLPVQQGFADTLPSRTPQHIGPTGVNRIPIFPFSPSFGLSNISFSF